MFSERTPRNNMLGLSILLGFVLIFLSFPVSAWAPSVGVLLLLVGAVLLSGAALGIFIVWFTGRRIARRSLHLALNQSLVLPGEEVEGHLELRLKRQRVLRSLTARAWGGEVVTISRGSDMSSLREEAPVLNESLVLEPEGSTPGPLSGEGEVAVGPGQYRFRFSIKIPEEAPPTTWLRGARRGIQGIQVRYFLRVRTDIRGLGGLEAAREFEIPVGSRGTPSDTRSTPAAPSSMQRESGRPTVRLELGHKEVKAGNPLKGTITVTGLGDKRIQGVRIRLVERQWGKAHGREISNSKTLAKTELPAQGGLGGIVAPFTLRVSPGARWSYVGQISTLRHIVRVRVRLAWAQDLRVEEEIRVVSRLP